MDDDTELDNKVNNQENNNSSSSDSEFDIKQYVSKKENR